MNFCRRPQKSAFVAIKIVFYNKYWWGEEIKCTKRIIDTQF